MMDSTTTSATTTATVGVSHLRRVAVDIANSTLAPTNNEGGDGGTDNHDLIFWLIHGLVFFLSGAVILYFCLYGDTSCFTRGARAEKRKQRHILPPEKRRALLLASFRRKRVSMTVQEKDIVSEDHENTTTMPVVREEQQQDAENVDCSGSVTSLNRSTSRRLRLSTGASVPNCCAICLGDYEAGVTVVWSSNQECLHAFHQECILDWLVKMQPATPCPCCRQEFTH